MIRLSRRGPLNRPADIFKMPTDSHQRRRASGYKILYFRRLKQHNELKDVPQKHWSDTIIFIENSNKQKCDHDEDLCSCQLPPTNELGGFSFSKIWAPDCDKRREKRAFIIPSQSPIKLRKALSASLGKQKEYFGKTRKSTSIEFQWGVGVGGGGHEHLAVYFRTTACSSQYKKGPKQKKNLVDNLEGRPEICARSVWSRSLYLNKYCNYLRWATSLQQTT